MTGPSPSGHLDLDALADVLAGERTGERHLRECAACAERLDELAAAEVALVASLATLPSPPLPDGLSERLAAALRAEATGPSGAASSSGAGGPNLRSVPTSSSARTSRPVQRRRTPSWLPAVAVWVGLVLAGGLGLNALTGTGGQGASSDTVSDTAGGGGGGGGEAQESLDAAPDQDALARLAASGSDYADPAQRAAALPGLLAAAATAFAADSALPEPAAPQEAAPLPSAAPPASQRSAVPTSALADGRLSASALDRLRDPGAFAACLAALRREGAPSAEPIALDAARFEGAPALAVVQPDTDPARVVLSVVGPRCSAEDSDTLLQTRVARP